jgi:DNA-directed RNA polymerase specialized sigma24 family protein
VRSALGTLPPHQRTLLLVLHSGPARSYEAVGAALGMPVGSIGPTRGRALERLRREVSRRPAAGATAQAR